MSTMLLERRPPAYDESFEHRAHRWLDGALAGDADAHGRLTLDDLITSVWEGLAVRDAVSCPVCAGPMALGSRGGSDESPTGACLQCGSRLA